MHLMVRAYFGAFVYRLVREIVDLLGAVRLRYAPPILWVLRPTAESPDLGSG